MKSARKLATRRKVTRRAPTLSARVERLEKVVLFPTATATPPKAIEAFTNLDAKGKPTTGDHVAVHQGATGLIWTAAPLEGGKGYNHANAIKAAADLDLLGSKGWRLPTIQELLSIVDYGRCDPAVDPKHFKGPYGWTWSSTVAAAPSGVAWSVYLYFGYSSRDYQSLESHVLAVRAGQQFGLGI
jgi:Protein of unknown function (DUF1566)